jgi:hypothetical protein
MADLQLQTTVLLVSADSAAAGPTAVYFEPEGADHQLAPGEEIRIEAVLPVGYEIEIWHDADSITLHAESTWGLRAWRKNGLELKL